MRRIRAAGPEAIPPLAALTDRERHGLRRSVERGALDVSGTPQEKEEARRWIAAGCPARPARQQQTDPTVLDHVAAQQSARR